MENKKDALAAMEMADEAIEKVSGGTGDDHDHGGEYSCYCNETFPYHDESEKEKAFEELCIHSSVHAGND